jgi:putative ABC transport system permease protein
MRLIRDLGRRRLRTTLTILGITIGIWALVVFGSMANKISAVVDGGSLFYADKVTATGRGDLMGLGSPLDIATAERVAALESVDVVVPTITMYLGADASGLTIGQQMVAGQVAGADQGRESFLLNIATGRDLAPADEGSNVAVLGSDLARQEDLAVGDSTTIRGETFEVVGILEPTLTMPDITAMVPLAAAQRLYLGTLPTIVAANLEPRDVVSGLTIYPQEGTDPETVAAAIRAAEPDLMVMSGADFDDQVGSATAILNAILVGIALISLAVGGLSVINTMAMSVAERTREIGIKRAIGGSRRRIVSELVAESALIGLLGGVIGLTLGAALAFIGNELGRSSGFVLFMLTPSTAVTAVAFSTTLGAVAGLVPALHAARLDPVSALRYE